MSSREVKVLLLEKNAGDVRLVQEAFKRHQEYNLQLENVHLLKNALARLSENKFDIVLLSLFLPDAHGLEPVVEIRKAHPTTPIVVLSGIFNEKNKMEALSSGANDYFVKDGLLDGSLVKVISHCLEL
jgi:DNA-binding response OmpR family regulator